MQETEYPNFHFLVHSPYSQAQKRKKKKNFNGYFHGKDHLSQSVSLKSRFERISIGFEEI
ncbi:hypothetical protein LEP1GSC043_3765 [Leptospira weilii str. Ecochallenge]|uniref:Uncharacterized protein n=1 Tax=Leptospira weilii str. Ecochallenge TaxID=1049986 RepID=N1UHI4_9LEPT|nr:hypothetical protein LEP1GSC043_3765 [Leptospira weilii str. Ecochallenge]